MAIVICTVMIVSVLAPVAAGADHVVSKGQGGPRANALTWTYAPLDYGIYSAKIDNFGLRWLVIDIFDNTTGMPESVMHQRIRFAEANAYPSGTVYTEPIQMLMGRLYEITATPNGPRDTYATVSDEFIGLHMPVASFTMVAYGLTVVVDASSSYDPDGNIVEYNWYWGDGMTGSGVTATHTYAAYGTYEITLTVVDGTGLSDSVTALIHGGGPPPPPVAVITYVVDGHTVYVDGSASFDADGTIVSFAWDFGDGATAVGPTVSHTYAESGNYILTLVVTDNLGMTCMASQLVYIEPDIVVLFSYTVAGLNVSVDASALRSGGDWTIASYSWDWDDGSVRSSGVAASHTYSVAGTYTIILTMTDTNGSVMRLAVDVLVPGLV